MTKKLFSILAAFFMTLAAISFGADLIDTLRHQIPGRFEICMAFGIAVMTMLGLALDYLAKALGVETR